jgi:hypothetical protein
MSTMKALARLRAARTGHAQPAATVRHRHLSDRPLVFVPYALAGEAFAPLAALVGTDPQAPELLIVPQPRDRTLRFGFVSALAEIVLPYVTGFEADTETIEPKRKDQEAYERALDAPQILVPSHGGVDYLRLLGRSTRFRKTEGEYAVPAPVPLLGRWSTYLAERTRTPGSSMVLAMTDLLTQTWTTGQSAVEDGTLATLFAWIDPPAGRTGAEAAAAADREPGAGPATEPEFDEKLAPLVAAYDKAVKDEDPESREKAERILADILRAELLPTWRRMWRGLDLLRELPAGASVAGRWESDRNSYTFFTTAQAEPDSRPQPRVPQAVAAAAQLNSRERAADRLLVEEVRDDPLLMAEVRLGGEAFRGPVVTVEADRMVTEPGKKQARPRPLMVIRTEDEPLILPGSTVSCVERPDARARLVSVDGDTVTLELTGGMGGAKKPKEGSVPEPGEVLCWTSLSAEFRGGPSWPEVEDTPWTHGGPPVDPTEEEETRDATETWA